ncbi:MAG: hypothetical protein CM1200mP4_2430 [Rhodospirillaceae bacterium]|nr:MAG: hypothetical protein CM1200mP4_2430 [Rhodospirillaceae bacterium]
MPSLSNESGGCIFTTSGTPDSQHNQHHVQKNCFVIDAQVRIIYPGVIIFWALKDNGFCLKHPFLPRADKKLSLKSSEITEVFISALSKRLPDKTSNPALS